MKIKIFKQVSQQRLEGEVNEFLKTLKPEQFVDLKSSSSQYSVGGADIVVIIIYKP